MHSRRHSRQTAARYRATYVSSYTRRRLGGRQPLCGIGVTSRMAVISSPTACRERIAASRPAPGPRTKTSTCLSPTSIALRAAFSAAVCAANGVLLREPLKPTLPALAHETTLPILSVKVTMVLLKVACTWAMPAHGKTLAVPDAPVAADVHQPLHAHRHLAAQVALDLVLALDDVADPPGLVVAPGLHPFVGIDPCVGEDLLGCRNADPVDVLDRDLTPLVPRQIDSGDTCHVCSYPWRCLWRGFLQMIRTMPSRRTILQFSHRTLIDGRTFIPLPLFLSARLAFGCASPSSNLLEPICDPAPREVIGRQLHLHLVARQDADEVHPHLARHVGQHLVAVLQLDPEHRVGQRLDHRALHLDRILFGHVRGS